MSLLLVLRLLVLSRKFTPKILTKKTNKNSQIIYILNILISILIPKIAIAQITPDGTLPSNVNYSSGTYSITGGVNPQNSINLFHSLQNFSLASGETVQFIHNQNIHNIITRITGNSPSQIDGTITTLINGTNNISNANLFLINPQGIIFGANAKLNMGGSFIASTADSMKFADGTEFSAIQPTNNHLLTITAPIGLQFGTNPHSNIQVNGTGNQLILNINNNSLNESKRPQGLSFINPIPQNQTLALIGGNLIFNGGNMTFPQGNIELWAVNQGFVGLTNNGKIEIQPASNINYGNIDLIKAASINASGDGGGTIKVAGKNINLQDGSVIYANTKKNGTSGIININATDSLKVTGSIFTTTNQIYTSIFANLDPNATGGNGGQIFINTKNLELSETGQISANTYGVGTPSRLDIKAKDIKIIGNRRIGVSGLFAEAYLGLPNEFGSLNIETETLQITQGGKIFTSTSGTANAGNLTIKAQDIEVQGESITSTGRRSPSSIFANVQSSITNIPASGNGGNLFIETNNLRVADAAQIAVSTSGIGNAGNLEIQANSIELKGFSSSGRSGLFATARIDKGNAGNIKITSNELKVTDGAIISVSNFQSQNLSLPGTGAAGNIQINSPFLLLKNQGIISADSNVGDKGNISIESKNLQLRQGSYITANARNSSQGGNITISTNTLLALENSDITANAQKGFGGRVMINAKGIFGTKFRPRTTSESDITASSDLGIELNGTVEINTPDVDPSTGITDLSTNLVDVESLVGNNLCADEKIAKGSYFIVSGTGGLPANSEDLITHSPGIIEWSNRSLEKNTSPVILSQKPKNNSHEKSNKSEFIQAQGWLITNNGRVILTKENPVLLLQNSNFSHLHCHNR